MPENLTRDTEIRLVDALGEDVGTLVTVSQDSETIGALDGTPLTLPLVALEMSGLAWYTAVDLHPEDAHRLGTALMAHAKAAGERSGVQSPDGSGRSGAQAAMAEGSDDTE